MEDINMPCIINEHEYKLSLPPETDSSKVTVKQIFMAGYDSVVVHIQNNKHERQDLVSCNLNGNQILCPLRYRSTVKQLNKDQFIVLHHDDCSVDKIILNYGRWKIVKIRGPQIILFYNFEVMLFMFNETQSFCIVERYLSKTQKMFYYKKNKDSFELVQEITMQYNNQSIIQINELSKIGWLQRKSLGNSDYRGQLQVLQKKQILYIIDFTSTKSKLIQIPIYKPKGQSATSDFTITKITEISQRIYLCEQKEPKFYIYNTNIMYEPRCMQRLICSEQNQALFDFKSYIFKVYGPFAVAWKQFNKYPVIIDLHGAVSFGVRKAEMGHNINVNMHSYSWTEDKTNQHITFKVTTQVDLKGLFMQMLEYLNEDFDDDLLEDAIDLLIK